MKGFVKSVDLSPEALTKLKSLSSKEEWDTLKLVVESLFQAHAYDMLTMAEDKESDSYSELNDLRGGLSIWNQIKELVDGANGRLEALNKKDDNQTN